MRFDKLLLSLTLSLCACRPPSGHESSPFFFVDHVEEADERLIPAARQLRRNRALEAPMDLDGETRVSLTSPLGSALTFSLKLPSNPVLRFGIGLTSPEQSAAVGSGKRIERSSWATMRRVDSRIHIESEGIRETAFSEAVHRHQVGHWLDREVDLGARADATVRLTLEALPPARFRNRVNDQIVSALAQYLALWANPVLIEVPPSNIPRKIILISIDCLRADHMGVYGYSRDTTPYIDRFAQDGVLFTSAFANAPSTLPSHTSMFTGLTPSFHGASKWRKLDRKVPYLPEILSKSGFQTDGVVSGPYLSQWFGFERGFHSYNARSDPPANEAVDMALGALQRGRDMDQFLFLHLFDPHWPYLPPTELIERFGERPPDISDLLDLAKERSRPQNPREIQRIVDLYDAEIAYVDREVGRFLDALSAEVWYDEALIIPTADHGEAFYEHGHWQHSISLYEELLRVPLIVKWPGRLLRNRVGALVSHIDIFPTILDVMGLQVPALSPGVNLRRYVEGKDDTGPRDIISEFNWLLEDQNLVKVSFRAREIKYIATVSIPYGEEVCLDMIQEEELFDLSGDAEERHDISAERPESLGAFRKTLLDYLIRSQNIQLMSGGEEVILDEATKEQLKNLGYIHE